METPKIDRKITLTKTDKITLLKAVQNGYIEAEYVERLSNSWLHDLTDAELNAEIKRIRKCKGDYPNIEDCREMLKLNQCPYKIIFPNE